MYLKKIHIENFRLLRDIDIVLDKSLTLIVGKNNTGKTSVAHLLQMVINEKKNLSFDDYPLACRKQLYDILENYWAYKSLDADIVSQVQETKLVFYIDYSDDEEDQFLGELRNFIIDIDDTQNVARIDAVYSFNSSKAQELFDICHKRYNELLDTKENTDLQTEPRVHLSYNRSITAAIVKEQFNQFFSLHILAVNPADISDLQEKPSSLLKNFLPAE